MPYEALKKEVNRLEKGFEELAEIIRKMPSAATDGENGASQTKDIERITQMNEKRKLIQRDKIALYLAAHPGATNIEITADCYISSSSKRLSEMWQRGQIRKEICRVNKYGEKVHPFCRYYLAEVET